MIETDVKRGQPDPKGYIPNCYITPVVEKVWFRGEIKVVPSTLRMKSTSFFSLGTEILPKPNYCNLGHKFITSHRPCLFRWTEQFHL